MTATSTPFISDVGLFFMKTKDIIEELKNPDLTQEEITKYKRQVIDIETKSVDLYNKHCLSLQISSSERLRVLEEFIEFIQDAGYDMLFRLRDMVNHLRGNERVFIDFVDFLCLVTKSTKISGYQRLLTAITLYNQSVFPYCYNCFIDLSVDENIDYKYRVESVKYLYSSGAKDHVSYAHEVLTDLIEDEHITSANRYSIIAEFISATGIHSILSSRKLRVDYDEKFVRGLQTAFFYNPDNGPRERILSGQYLLQIDISADERTEIIGVLFDIARNEQYEENTRADAADVICRLGDETQKTLATAIIRELGFSVFRNGKMDGSEDVFESSQNIHEFSPQITETMEKIVETTTATKTYDEIHDEILRKIKKVTRNDNSRKFLALKALNRVNIDTAIFTKYKISLCEIFCLIYTIIDGYQKDVRKTLINRLIEELIDMGDTCSSGHSDRFVNVLQGFYFDLKVSWEDQIKSNVKARMMVAFRDLPDDQSAIVAIAQMEDAPEEEKREYVSILEQCKHKVFAELENEFVAAGHVDLPTFESYFSAAIKRFELS